MAKDTLTIELTGAKEIRKFLEPKAIANATRRTIDKTARAHRKESFVKMSEVFNIAQARIKRTKKGGRATTYVIGTTQYNFTARVGFYARRPGLQHFAVGRKKNYNPPKKRFKGMKLRNPKFKTLRAKPFAIFLFKSRINGF